MPAQAAASSWRSRPCSSTAAEGAKGQLPILWIADTVATMEAGRPHAVGLSDFGLKPRLFLHAAPKKLKTRYGWRKPPSKAAAFRPPFSRFAAIPGPSA